MPNQQFAVWKYTIPTATIAGVGFLGGRDIKFHSITFLAAKDVDYATNAASENVDNVYIQLRGATSRQWENARMLEPGDQWGPQWVHQDTVMQFDAQQIRVWGVASGDCVICYLT